MLVFPSLANTLVFLLCRKTNIQQHILRVNKKLNTVKNGKKKILIGTQNARKTSVKLIVQYVHLK